MPLGQSTRLVVVALSANGTSSYRDASALSRLFWEKFASPHCTILSDRLDTLSHCAPQARKRLVKNRSDLLSELRNTIGAVPAKCNLVFSLSAHGYSKRLRARTNLEMNGRTEYVCVNGEHVLDVDLFDALYQTMHPSVKSLCLIDTCHSGTMLDLEYVSSDGRHFQRSHTPPGRSPETMCISACSDNELAGEDISGFGGWGGKLTCHVLDVLSQLASDRASDHTSSGAPILLLEPCNLYDGIRSTFVAQSRQKSHPVLSYSRGS